MKPVLFFSHSSADKPRSDQLVRALEHGHRIETAFDARDLGSGRAWRPQLYRWITGCHGGIVLLTEAVLNEPYWVLQEATLMRARAAVEGDSFRLFVVVDATVLKDERFKTLFGPLALDQLQRIKMLDPAGPIEPLVEVIEAAMAEVAAERGDYYGLLAERIFDVLEPLFANKSVQRLLADGFEIANAGWQAIVEPQSALHTLCSRRLAQGQFGRFDGIKPMFNALQGLGQRNDRLALLGQLRSGWVPLANAFRMADALALLKPTADGELVPNLLLLQTDYKRPQEVAELHRERRFAPYGQLGTWVSVGGCDESAGRVAAEVFRCLRDEVYPNEGELSREDLLAELADDFDRGLYTFVHVEVSASVKQLLPAAREFWPCLFVATVPAAMRAELERELGTPAIVPPPDALSDTDHLRAVSRAQRFAEYELVPAAAAPP